MVTMPFFRNLTIQIKTFLGYYEKTKNKNKQENKQCSWDLRPTVRLLDVGEN